MAFASVISLKNIIERLLNSSKITFDPASYRMIESAYKKAKSLEENLQKLDSSSKRMNRKRVNALDSEIREKVSKFEDLLQSHLSLQISSQNHQSKFSIDLHLLAQDVNGFIKSAEKMEEDYIIEFHNMALAEEEEEVDDDDDDGSSNSKMIGLSDQLNKVRQKFTRPVIVSSLANHIHGMAGIGKTAFAKEIYNDPFVSSHYECFAWVRVGRKFTLNEIPRCILAQVMDSNELVGREGDDEQVINQLLYNFLKEKRYLIVLDDVWESEVWEYLRHCIPVSEVVLSRVLVTTRLKQVYQHSDTPFPSAIITLRLLNDEESWDLFREKVFGEAWCPPKLEEAGKKIVKNCDGLPLTIIKVAKLLSKVEINVDYWNEVAADKEHVVFSDVYCEFQR